MSIAAQLRPRIRAEGAAAMATAVETMSRAAEHAAPVDKGELRRSRRVSGIRSTATGFSATIQFTAPQAKWTEDGTRPHIIRARRGKVLRFVVGGRTVFARSVHHPGNKGTHWFTKTVTQARWAQALRAGFR